MSAVITFVAVWLLTLLTLFTVVWMRWWWRLRRRRQLRTVQRALIKLRCEEERRRALMQVRAR